MGCKTSTETYSKRENCLLAMISLMACLALIACVTGTTNLVADGTVELKLETAPPVAISDTYVLQDEEELIIYGKVNIGEKGCLHQCQVHMLVIDPDAKVLMEMNLPYEDRGARSGWENAGFRARIPLQPPRGSTVVLTFKDQPAYTEEQAPADPEAVPLTSIKLLEQARSMLRLDDYRKFEAGEVDFKALRFANPEDHELSGWLAQLYLAWAEQLSTEIDMLQKQLLASTSANLVDDMAGFVKLIEGKLAKLNECKTNAKTLAEQLVLAKPDHYIGYRVLADYYRLLGDKATMAEQLAEVRRLNPESVGLLFIEGAAKAGFDKDYKGAIALYDTALERDPNFVKALYFKALAYSAMPDDETAKSTMEAVLKASPEHPGARLYFSVKKYIADIAGEAKKLVE